MKFEGPGWAAFISEDGTDTGHRVMVSEDWCGGGFVAVCEGRGANRAKVAESVCDLPNLLQYHGYDPLEPHAAVRFALLELDGRIRRSGGGMILSFVHVMRKAVVTVHVGNLRAVIVGDGRREDLIADADRLRDRADCALGVGFPSKASEAIDIAVVERDPTAPFLLLGTTTLWRAIDNPEGPPATVAIASNDDPGTALDTFLAACSQPKLGTFAAAIVDLRS